LGNTFQLSCLLEYNSSGGVYLISYTFIFIHYIHVFVYNSYKSLLDMCYNRYK